ncbi:MAG: hypothetical protein ABIS20_01600 [Thermoanaerobaculia bacterium]
MQEELRAVRHGLDSLFGSQSHRQLYGSSEEVLSALLDQTSGSPQARIALDELIPAIHEYHRRAMAGGSEAWEEIRESYLEQARYPIRMVRGAAGWVVLLGLAGTVLGFGSAMPSLRNVLTSKDEVQIAPMVGETASATASTAEPATAAGKRLARVLDSLEGVFTATFAGVLSALLLSILALTLLEPAYNRLAREVDLLGARWFVPLIHAPDTLVDDALRGELKVYFDRISERMEAVLHPLVRSLSVSLTQMSGLATDFSGNIRMGVSTLETFRDAVTRLGGSAEGAVEQLVKIVSLSTSFVRELETLQEKGAKTLAIPAEKLASSATAIETWMGALDGRLESLGNATREVAIMLRERGQGEDTIRKQLARTATLVAEQTQALATSQTGLAVLPQSIQQGISPLLEAQRKVQESSRESLVDLAATTKSLHDLLAQATTRVNQDQWPHDLRRELERLHLGVGDLSDHLKQTQQGTEARGSRPEIEVQAELFRILRDIRSLLGGATRSRTSEGGPPRQLNPLPAETSRPAPTAWQGLKARLSRFFADSRSSQKTRR